MFAALFSSHKPLLKDLQHAGFAHDEIAAVRHTPPMWQQLVQFYQNGGRVERVDADFAGANGAPTLIRFYCSRGAQGCAHSTFGSLAHELGHALFCPQQWQDVASFLDAASYARAREMGEAHAWLNQYRLCKAKVGGQPENSSVLEIENDHDFGRQTVDIFARIAAREAAGWSDAQILDELAMLNANMFPCGMGEGNYKTYGQCNRWDYLQATRERNPAFAAFLQQLKRPPTANDQKVLMKFNLFTGAPANPAAAASDVAAWQPFAQAMCQAGAACSLPTLFDLAGQALPDAPRGVAGQCGRGTGVG